MKNIFTIYLLIVLFGCNSDTTPLSPVVGKVVDLETNLPISNANIIYNSSDNYVSDSTGVFRTFYNLGELLADSISFDISHDSFHSQNYSRVVGNTQKDIFIFRMIKK